MLANLAIVLPIFALIAVGWIARKSGALGHTATREISRFVLYLALPALLFEIMVTSSLDQMWQPGFILAYALGCALVFGATLACRAMQGKGLADAAIDGLNASCANTGFMGFPLILTVMGSSGLAPTLIASVLTVCVLCAIGLILIEFSMTSRAPQSGGHLQVLRRVALALVTNPILVAPLVGCLFLFLGVELPEPVDGFFTMLGAAASPCALIALGLFFAEKPVPRPSGQSWLVPALVSAKLLVHPAATWVVAGPLLGLPPPLLHTAVLLAALPTGTTPFMLTEVYHREAAITGKVVITSTIVAVFTLSGWLLLLAG